MRHPIIEQIQKKYEYVPNNCFIGKKVTNNEDNEDTKGILLYGINASGKSSYRSSWIKFNFSANLLIFCCCEIFTYYPYTKIFTRISGNDNIFKGHSSFAVEMLELRCILNRCDNRSLILGDELCKGFKSTSALAIRN